jgi:hypothetical protein
MNKSLGMLISHKDTVTYRLVMGDRDDLALVFTINEFMFPRCCVISSKDEIFYKLERKDKKKSYVSSYKCSGMYLNNINLARDFWKQMVAQTAFKYKK